MPVPAATATLYSTLMQILGVTQQAKVAAQSANTRMAAGNIDTQYVFNFLDQMRGLIVTINGWVIVPNLNTYANSNLPGYAGDLVNDLNATKAAGQACVDWVVTNFPKVNSGGTEFLLGETLNADGTRTSRQFSTAQTAGLRTLLVTFIATIA